MEHLNWFLTMDFRSMFLNFSVKEIANSMEFTKSQIKVLLAERSELLNLNKSLTHDLNEYKKIANTNFELYNEKKQVIDSISNRKLDWIERITGKIKM